MLTTLTYSPSAKREAITRVAKQYDVPAHIVEHGVQIFAHKGFDAALRTVEHQIKIDSALRTNCK